MKVGQIGPTSWVPEKTVNFFGVKPVVPSSLLKMRKSHIKSARVCAYTHAYTQIRDGGADLPAPELNRVNTNPQTVLYHLRNSGRGADENAFFEGFLQVLCAFFTFSPKVCT